MEVQHSSARRREAVVEAAGCCGGGMGCSRAMARIGGGDAPIRALRAVQGREADALLQGWVLSWPPAWP